ncbi:response regulator transcription factor [Paenibacillus alginolyticus]|uniref:Response regulator transcription factor n=1 Tax=Paenibacillus alginolyticus TaxID=59839 RepID=A0ABT4GL65_9BACL|nr:response regulator transcription factor [Paenibacillus alginolyticus]MCY9669663.1 response regulator transcription factor [Paenibacillus alginolyticus]MCY9696928.1 response regulator transcription factor [Paenibacillus alginolyticus]MEC0145524.1 response regulator transcription factor [Paenibacillus alginolyticus]
MGSLVLVVDDETNIIDVCTVYLQREGYQVISAVSGDEAIRLWRLHSPQLIVLDLMMPGKNGWQVCEEIRNEQDVPIIMLTARGDEMDRLMGLTMGADDYLTKPFSPRELVLRAKAILRRQQRGYAEAANGAGAVSPAHIMKFPGLELNVLHRSVRVNGKEIELTVKEFELLHLFTGHPEQVFSRNQLLSKVWDIDYYGDTTTVTVHIRRLREKIEPNPSEPRYIKTVWGIGYKFEGREPS